MTVTYVRTSEGVGNCVATATPATLVNGTTIFTISGGPIRIQDLFSYCITVNDTTAATLQWSIDADDTVAGAVTITAASGALTSFAVGGIVYCNLTTINTAPVITQTTGVALAGPTTSTGGGIYAPAGIITTVIGSGPTTGTWQHFMRYVRLDPNAKVTAAF